MQYRISFTIDSSITDSSATNLKKIRDAIKNLNIDVEDEITGFPRYIKIKEFKVRKARYSLKK
jgi:hypothetical protein